MTSVDTASANLLASAGADSVLRIWDPERASLLRELTSHTAQINHITTVRDKQPGPEDR